MAGHATDAPAPPSGLRREAPPPRRIEGRLRRVHLKSADAGEGFRAAHPQTEDASDMLTFPRQRAPRGHPSTSPGSARTRGPRPIPSTCRSLTVAMDGEGPRVTRGDRRQGPGRNSRRGHHGAEQREAVPWGRQGHLHQGSDDANTRAPEPTERPRAQSQPESGPQQSNSGLRESCPISGCPRPAWRGGPPWGTERRWAERDQTNRSSLLPWCRVLGLDREYWEAEPKFGLKWDQASLVHERN